MKAWCASCRSERRLDAAGPGKGFCSYRLCNRLITCPASTASDSKGRRQCGVGLLNDVGSSVGVKGPEEKVLKDLNKA